MGWAIPGATEFLGQLGRARNIRGVTGHDEVKRNQTLKALVRKDTTKPVIHLLLHWIDKTCFELWRAVAERGRWSSAAPGQQLPPPPLKPWPAPQRTHSVCYPLCHRPEKARSSPPGKLLTKPIITARCNRVSCCWDTHRLVRQGRKHNLLFYFVQD